MNMDSPTLALLNVVEQTSSQNRFRSGWQKMSAQRDDELNK